ncbi:MAG TPA: hypothetical protein VIG88_11350, partial [Lysobacter sp.]
MPDVQVDRLKPLLPLAAALALLLAGWFGWNAWAQWRDEARRADVQAARDVVVASMGATVRNAQKRFTDQLASPGVRDALARGMVDRAAEQLTAGWKGASGGEVRPAELGGVYDALGRKDGPSYGHVAALETAIATRKPVALAIREGGALWLGL